MKDLDLVLFKPTGYDNGVALRHIGAFLPDAVLAHMKALIPQELNGCTIRTHVVNENTCTDLRYMRLLEGRRGSNTLILIVGTQSWQVPRALDIAAYAMERGCMVALGGPHFITCKSDELARTNGQMGIALAEAEVCLAEILRDATEGQLNPVYGNKRRWVEKLPPLVIRPDLGGYASSFTGIFGYSPYRGCPKTCSFCSIPLKDGRQVRGQEVDDVMKSLRLIKKAGYRCMFITSDNTNKWTSAKGLFQAMIEDRLDLPFIMQCDVEASGDEEFFSLASQAGCCQMFFGIETIDPGILKREHKFQNDPQRYRDIVDLCAKYGVTSNFSNMIGFMGQSKKSILDHLDAISNVIEPDLTLWFIVTTLPGTPDWATAIREGWKLDQNLSNYDATKPVFKHDHLGYQERLDLMFHCIAKFHDVPKAMRKVINRKGYNASEMANRMALVLFNRYCAARRVHPLSGGLYRVGLDRECEYLPLRERTFGFRMVPLPKNRPLSDPDKRMNALVDIQGVPVVKPK